ncbi:MAG: UvrD-helicase domain-containing protein [Kiritimatiellae bacterium]|nr:UvrD-helicase domain-containing protein [Kiritimatiellia bacterium]
MRERNLLIRASAGTGKTYALATRYLQLMLVGKVDPAKIVALTFSRAAAQEIYTKILERLWTAAKSEENAKKESEEISKASKIPKSWSKTEFASLLRSLIDTQHLGTIATLDSFILRLVRNFPLEMGFQHAVEVLDPAGEGDAIQDALRAILQGTEKAEDFIKVFAAAHDGNLPRVLEYKIMAVLKRWRKFYELRPDCRNWTVESMLKALGIPEISECPDLSSLPFCQIQRKNTLSYEEQFANKSRLYDGSVGVFDVTDGVKKLMLHFLHNSEAESYEYDFYKKHYVFNCGKDGAAAIRSAIQHMFNLRIQRLLKQVKAKIDFVSIVEDVYNRNSRRKGKLTFSDFTKFSAAKEGSKKAIDLANLEYRFDEKFDHWALDEFQDTSELQWVCLRSLVEAAATSGGERTVMAVGDLKQSIYTWRGGNDGPFMEMMSWGAFTDSEFGKIDDLNTSYRYEKNICDFINAVFGEKSLRASGILAHERSRAIERWLSSDCWKVHEPVFKDGVPKVGDYVKVLGVPDSEGEAKMNVLLPALENELKRIRSEHNDVDSSESVGILVRTNDDGNEVAEYLRSRGFKVVWEGMSAVSDLPIVNALIDLLRLSEHPADAFAWKTVSQLFPICSTLFPKKNGDELSAAFVSSIVATNLSHQGLSRTLQKYCQALSEDSVGLDLLSKQRLREIVALAVAYEQRNANRFSIDGFEAFLAASFKREQGTSSGVVRILTIHRSKGLTLDRVIVPLAEGATWLADIDDQELLCAPEGGWVLPHLSVDEAALNPKMAKALSERLDESLLSNIRMWYVALTRARKAMYIIAPLVERNEEKPFFRDVILSAFADFKRLPAPNECKIIFEQGVEPEFKPRSDKNGKDGRVEHESWHHEKLAETVERLSPSSSGHRNFAVPASYLFSESAGEAARKGVEIHGQYEAVEWTDEEALAALPKAFHVAFVKPGPEATLWREKSYEIYREASGKGEWETGQFDRVVFTGVGDEREAVIYDFKTNALKSGESTEAFEQRMSRTYSPQMSAYRAALATLTGLPPKRIRLVLLLESTGTAVECAS